ncbi:MAG: hypothetical protein IJO32_04360 [Bacilli bacterium]|nr:hypothetical protein [Bacilli bacterium]
MNKKVKKILTISLILIISLFGIFLEINYLLNKKKQEQKVIQTGPIYLKKETVQTTLEKYNTKILDNGMNTPINIDDYVIQNNIYHYTIYEDISLYIKPIEYTGNQTKEITYDLGIYYPKDTINEGKAKIYLKILINSNINKLSDEKTEKLINEAIEISKEAKDLNKNIGISIRYFDSDTNNNYKEFVIRRHYE